MTCSISPNLRVGLSVSENGKGDGGEEHSDKWGTVRKRILHEQSMIQSNITYVPHQRVIYTANERTTKERKDPYKIWPRRSTQLTNKLDRAL